MQALISEMCGTVRPRLNVYKGLPASRRHVTGLPEAPGRRILAREFG